MVISRRFGLLSATLLGTLFLACSRGDKPQPPDIVLSELISDPSSPIKFDPEVGEYQLVYKTVRDGEQIEQTYILKYSPFTGARLPSRREDLFMKPSAAEIRLVKSKFSKAKTLQDVERSLGPPDDVVTNSHGFRVEYIYRKRFDTLEVIVQERTDGRVVFSYAGKKKR
jgi:hypothetical protein